MSTQKNRRNETVLLNRQKKSLNLFSILKHIVHLDLSIMGLEARKPVFGGLRTTHPRSLLSAFVIRFLESILCILATGEISIF